MPIVTGTKDDGTAQIGIYIDPTFDFPVDVKISIDDIGGPSAGTMFALGIIDKMTPEDETGGKDIAGTGTIDVNGEVGAIGGIRQKLAGAHRDGATWFLAPASNCDEVVGHVPDGLRVAKISTLHEAREAVTAIGAGKGDDLPTCTAVAPQSNVERTAATSPGTRSGPWPTCVVGVVVRAHPHGAPRRPVPQRADGQPHVLALGVRQQVLQGRGGVLRHRLLGGGREHHALDRDGHPVDRRRPRQPGEQRLQVGRRGQLLLLDRGQVPGLRGRGREDRRGRAGRRARARSAAPPACGPARTPAPGRPSRRRRRAARSRGRIRRGRCRAGSGAGSVTAHGRTRTRPDSNR